MENYLETRKDESFDCASYCGEPCARWLQLREPRWRRGQNRERRAAAEKKRAENIKKRAEKAAEYERQVKLREEQKKNSVTGDLVPRL